MSKAFAMIPRKEKKMISPQQRTISGACTKQIGKKLL